MFKILSELDEIPINDILISTDKGTRGEHSQHNHADKHIRADTTTPDKGTRFILASS